ncbi:SulP family inorganic anion transporter, partial [Streptomyces narbonensis]
MPGPLVVVALGTAAVAAFGLDEHGIAVIGDVPSGLPHPALPDVDELSRLMVPALGLLLVGYTDVILTARAFATDDQGGRLDANQELLALGAANLGAGLLSGFPVSNSASRTALADSTGARSQVYSLTAAVAVLAVLLFVSPLLELPPPGTCRRRGAVRARPLVRAQHRGQCGGGHHRAGLRRRAASR